MGKCEKCGKDISEKVEGYSNTNYGKPLCFDCQKLPEMQELAKKIVDSNQQKAVSVDDMEEQPDVIDLHGKKFITHQGLLRKAHKEGLMGIDTIRITDNLPEGTIMFKALVYMKDKNGTEKAFKAHGDASVASIETSMKQHIIRLAETRAINRALRLATNTGICSSEELGGKEEDEPVSAEESKPVQG